MNKTASSLVLAAAVFASGSALADGNANPDARDEAHRLRRISSSASARARPCRRSTSTRRHGSTTSPSTLTSTSASARKFGPRRSAATACSIALGYAGAADFNGDEILHIHAFGVTLRKSWLYVTLDGGVAMLNGFQTGDTFVGGHFGVNWGFRIGPVQIGLPISVDVFAAPAYTFAATLGFQM